MGKMKRIYLILIGLVSIVLLPISIHLSETGSNNSSGEESDIRYLKYYLARRLRFLDQEWLSENNHYEPEKRNGGTTTITGRILAMIFQSAKILHFARRVKDVKISWHP